MHQPIKLRGFVQLGSWLLPRLVSVSLTFDWKLFLDYGWPYVANLLSRRFGTFQFINDKFRFYYASTDQAF